MIEQLTRELELFFDELPQQSQLLSITLPFHQRPFTAPLLPQEGIYWHNGTNRTRKLAFGSFHNLPPATAGNYAALDTSGSGGIW